MYSESRLPFSSWIVPDPRNTNGSSKSEVPPPVYARDPGFSFDLGSILTEKSAGLSMNPTDITPGLHETLKNLTSLDEGQCDALIAALSHEFCLIQGPPGTGKSYLGVQLMRVLVSNKARAELGPIVVVWVITISTDCNIQTNSVLLQVLHEPRHRPVSRAPG
jgi:hypothetical protein